MSGQLTEFLASIANLGVAKTSHFRLFVPVKVAGSGYSGLEETLGVRCEVAELPGRQLVSNDSRTYGPSYKTPYQSVFQEITLTFIETGDFLIRGFFETWMNSIFQTETNLLNYPIDTRYTVTLTQYDVMLALETVLPNEVPPPDAELRKIAIWQLVNSFPTAVNQMPVAWAEDGVHRVTVTLAFEWYKLSTAVEPVPEGASSILSPAVKPQGSSQGIISSLKSKLFT